MLFYVDTLYAADEINAQVLQYETCYPIVYTMDVARIRWFDTVSFNLPIFNLSLTRYIIIERYDYRLAFHIKMIYVVLIKFYLIKLMEHFTECLKLSH